jgi:hypothetical protein
MEHLQESFRSRAGLLALLLTAAALCFISGCDTNYGLPNPIAPGLTGPGYVGLNEVKILNNTFSPDTIIVQRYATITWLNNDFTSHTVTSNEGLFDSGTLTRNETFEYAFETKGTFTYRCVYLANLHGTVIVQ